MKSLLNPKWLYIINTAPVLLLYFILGNTYAVINTLLTPNSKELWAVFAIALGVLGLLNFGYASYLTATKKRLTVAYGYLALALHITYLYFYFYYANDLLPNNIPIYMVPGNIPLYACTFLMPTMAYSLFIIVVTQTGNKDRAVVSFLNAIGVVVTFFILCTAVNYFSSTIFNVILISTLLGAVIFLYFLIKTVYILTINKKWATSQYRLVWRIPVGIVMPLLGLLINNGGVRTYEYASGIFGNFGNVWFYILALINGILLCLPQTNNTYYRVALFFARSVTFSYTLYFFLVFLPFLPLSIVAVIIIGIGFLMLAPLLLFIMHAHDLTTDYSFLRTWLSKTKTTAIFITGLLIIPVYITMVNLHEKQVLKQALTYVYEPDYTKEYAIDTLALKNTLNVLKTHKDRSGFGFSGEQTPYLSTYYNHIVLDNLTLSDDKISDIEKIFFGQSDQASGFQRRDNNPEKDNVVITKFKPASKYNSTKQQWESTLELEITNVSGNDLSEYETNFTLPQGCWINDYYLYIGNKKEKGILAEKKAAAWLYNQITNTNRDPGILFYTGGNTVSFKVFPFGINETRKTGIGFIHKDAVTITIDGKEVTLGSAKKETGAQTKKSGVVYVSTAEKALLKKVQRKPYFHFIIDVSKNAKENRQGYITSINNIIAERADMGKPRISFANTYTTTLPQNTNWQAALQKQEFTGGFYAGHAIKKILANTYNHTTGSYPVIVLVTNSIQDAIIDKNFADLQFTYPETNVFHSLDGTDNFSRHALTTNPKEILFKNEPNYTDTQVLAWPQTGPVQRYLKNDTLPEIILTAPAVTAAAKDFTAQNWESGLLLQGEFIQQTLHPETSGALWESQVQHSFTTGIMSPYTSYIVLENQAQKEVLKRKQESVLSADKSLDADEEAVPLPKPWLWITLFLGIIFVWFNQKRLGMQGGNTKQK